MAGIIPWKPPVPTPPPAPAPIPPPPIQVVAGIDPNELANATYGQQIPIVALGKARLGGRIIFGPYINSGAATFAVSFGMPANPSGTRVLFEIALDSKLVWESAAGTATISSGTFLAETFTARFYQGTQTQAVDPLETAQFGNEAIAYRPQLVIFFDSLPLTPFNNKVPWVAALIGDTTNGAIPADGITLGTAIDRIAKSPWVGHTSETFETTGVDDIVDAVIIADDADFISHLKNLNRFYRNFGIVQSDKLYVIDRGNTVTPDLTLTEDHICEGPVTWQLDAPTSIPRELELITIDPDADYSLVPSKAQFPNHPVAVSASVQRESVSLPIVVDAHTRISLATYAKHNEETARKKVKFRVMARGMEVEPMDYVVLASLANGFPNEVVKVLESTLNGDWTIDVFAEAIMKCDLSDVIDTDNCWEETFFLSGFNGVDGATTALDESPSEWGSATAVGAGQIDTAVSVFGGSAYLGSGATSCFAWPDGGTVSRYSISATPFCVEAWIVPTGSSPSNDIICGVSNGVSLSEWVFWINTGGELEFAVVQSGSSVPLVVSSGISWSAGTKYYVRADSDGTTVRLYRGVLGGGTAPMINSSTPASLSHDSAPSTDFSVGGQANGGLAFQGHIDEVRCARCARSGSDSGVPVPTTAFPRA